MALSGTSERGKATLKEDLEILVQQATCPICGKKLGALKGLAKDHIIPLALGGLDVPENIQFIHEVPCHSSKTNGKPHTSLGSDKANIAKTKRIRKKLEDILSAQDKHKRPIPSRGFDKSLTKGFDGKVKERNQK